VPHHDSLFGAASAGGWVGQLEGARTFVPTVQLFRNSHALRRRKEIMAGLSPLYSSRSKVRLTRNWACSALRCAALRYDDKKPTNCCTGTGPNKVLPAALFIADFTFKNMYYNVLLSLSLLYLVLDYIIYPLLRSLFTYIVLLLINIFSPNNILPEHSAASAIRITQSNVYGYGYG